MIALCSICLLLGQFPGIAAHATVNRGSLRADVGSWHDFIAQMLDDMHDDRIEIEDRNAALHTQMKSSPSASALRLKPEYYNQLVSYFEVLDSNPDGELSEFEFMKVADHDASMAHKHAEGRQMYDLFSNADGKPGMTLQEFLRLVTVLHKADFVFQGNELEAFPTASNGVATDQDRDALMRVFVVFDEDSSGDVGKAEFERAWMGPTLWTCRKKGVLSSAWMASTPEFDYAKGVFGKRAGADNALSLAEFALLVQDAVKFRDEREVPRDYYAKGGAYKGPLPHDGSSQSLKTLTPFFFTFVVTAVIG